MSNERPPDYSNWSNKIPHPDNDFRLVVYTAEEFERFNCGVHGCYIAIMGKIYDVQRKKEHYGPGAPYHFFAGRDASVAFITGDFETINDKLDDVLGSLTPQQILSLEDWQNFYEREYDYVGLVEGRFYNIYGRHTKYQLKVNSVISQAKMAKYKEEAKNDDYPQCNVEWSEERGTTVWCSDMSGGKSRDWIGVPRDYSDPVSRKNRCACVKEAENYSSFLFKEYEGCDPKSRVCTFKTDD